MPTNKTLQPIICNFEIDPELIDYNITSVVATGTDDEVRHMFAGQNVLLVRKERLLGYEEKYAFTLMTPKRSLIHERVAVLASNPEGEPDCIVIIVELTAEQYAAGEHHQMAKDQALDAGYTPPMFTIAQSDALAKKLPGLAELL